MGPLAASLDGQPVGVSEFLSSCAFLRASDCQSPSGQVHDPLAARSANRPSC